MLELLLELSFLCLRRVGKKDNGDEKHQEHAAVGRNHDDHVDDMIK